MWRLVQSIRANQPPEVVGRIETAPGEVAQVDFGYVGYLLDPERGVLRKAWAFVTPALACRCKCDPGLEPPPVR